MTVLGWELYTIGVGGLLVGLILGVAVAYFFLPSRRGEKEFEKIRKEAEVYQGQVHEHFVRTSRLFQKLNTDYRSLYEHLAEGAHTLLKGEIGSPDLEMLRLNMPLDPESTESTVDILSESGADTPSEGVWEAGAEEAFPAEKKSPPKTETSKVPAAENAEDDKEDVKRS